MGTGDTGSGVIGVKIPDQRGNRLKSQHPEQDEMIQDKPERDPLPARIKSSILTQLRLYR